MPIIVEYKNGQKEAIQGETFVDWNLMNREGKIHAVKFMDGHSKIIFREDVRAIEFFPGAIWNEEVDKQKKEQEKAAADQAQQLEADKAKQAEKEAHRQANAAWRRKSFLVRWVTKKPFPELG